MRRGLLAALATLALLTPAEAQESLALRSTAAPRTARLGEVITYRGVVTGGPAGRYRWIAPERREDLTWGAPRTYRRVIGRSEAERGGPNGTYQRAGGAPDSLIAEIPVQVFALGLVEIPGMRLEVSGAGGRRVVALPPVRVEVVPTLDPRDTSATLEPLRTIAAPWWERVPWTWIVIGVLALALVVWAWRRWRRRKPAPVAAPAAAARRDPRAEALEALARLRAMGLPEQGRFAEHAFRLGQILRRYLEATVITTRPGDTTPELITHLREARLDGTDLQRLSGLLRVWDRVKFAREAFTADEAGSTEQAVEGYVHRGASPPPSERAA